MNILAVIPARGDSKSIPRKNIVNVNDKPLISYTISAALEVDCLTDIVVSTEDPEIAEISRNYGAEVPFTRPAELAQDDTPDFPVFEHALSGFKKKKGSARICLSNSDPRLRFAPQG